MSKSRIIQKAVIIAIFLIIAVTSSAGILYYHKTYKALKNNIIDSHIRRTEDNADLVVRMLNEFKTNIEGVALRTEIQTMDWTIQKPLLIQEVERLNVTRLQVADLDGLARSTNDVEFDISDRDHFIKALQGETVITDPLVSRVDGSLVVICATPIRNDKGIIVGVLTAAMHPNFLFDIIKNRKIGDGGYGVIISKKGIVIAHPKEEILLTEAAATWDKDELPKELEDLAKIEKEMMDGKTGFGCYDYYGVHKCMFYTPIPGTTWAMGLTAPYSVVFNDLQFLNKQFLIILVVGIFVSLALTILALIYIGERQISRILKKDIEKSHLLLVESEELDRIKTHFFTTISHELKTPLNIISGAVQLCNLHLETNPELNVLDKYLKMIKQNTQRLLRLINNLIDITRIDLGYLEVHLENQNIVAIVEDITMSIVEYAKLKNIHVVFDTTVEELITAVDAEKIERIILNLLSNAIKFTDDGGSIFVNVYDKKDTVYISVRDTGIGIPEDKQKLVFEPFRQVNQLLTKAHEGSGIGLSLVKSMVEMHNGQIYIQSEVDKGSEFIIELPIKVLADKDNKTENSSCSNSYSTSEEKVQEEFSDTFYVS